MQKVIAIIPARGGSTGVIRKNVKPILGKPLVAYTIEQAQQSRQIERVIISTDDTEIAEIARQLGAEVILRPAEISGDEATSESALRHVLDFLEEKEDYKPDLVVFLQATSPLRRPNDIQNAIELLQQSEADSLFSACPLHSFIWRQQKDSFESLNYNFQNRIRRQDAPHDFLENGSIYLFKPWVLRKYDNRLGGKITMYEMDVLDSFQVDELADLELVEHLLLWRRLSLSTPDLSTLRLLVLDFEGVLTNNLTLVSQDGRESITVHRGDGWGIVRLKEVGIEVVVISTEANPVVAAYCRKLKIPSIQNCHDKLGAIQTLAQDRGLQKSEVAFVGNDLNDMPALGWVGHPIAVEDAVPQVLNVAEWITDRPGGFGAVREICDLILVQRENGK